ncbi:hypothetical protein BBOV_III005680 [Babesia bovis T2Bo]|uniref:hypothetical protein n=1 Tax=Babesia bovis T2Bo TaxID=484906 RepID=UPI001C34D56D|nr:hypothetical protein BBOV_III005680 [Babesia bovis T2Bo]EDO08131.2 hypothetical protein BBOV_III005680 [Babesia bovis T2Bo]
MRISRVSECCGLRGSLTSVDFQPHARPRKVHRLATAASTDVQIWALWYEESAKGPPAIRCLCLHTFRGHSPYEVAIARWSPNGKYLASTDSGGVTHILERNDDKTRELEESLDAYRANGDTTNASQQTPSETKETRKYTFKYDGTSSKRHHPNGGTPNMRISFDSQTINREVVKPVTVDKSGGNFEIWKSVQSFRCPQNMGQLFDLSWAPDNCSIVGGGLNGQVAVFDIVSKQVVAKFNVYDECVPNAVPNGRGYIKSVAWDPMTLYIAVQTSGRDVSIWRRSPPHPKGSADKWTFKCVFTNNDLFKKSQSDLLGGSRISWAPNGQLVAFPSAGGSNLNFTACFEVVHDALADEKKQFRKGQIGADELQFAYDTGKHSIRHDAMLLHGHHSRIRNVRFCQDLMLSTKRKVPKATSEPYRYALYAQSSDDGVISIWRFRHYSNWHTDYNNEALCLCVIKNASDEQSSLEDIAWGNNGKWLAAASSQGGLILIELNEDESQTRYYRNCIDGLQIGDSPEIAMEFLSKVDSYIAAKNPHNTNELAPSTQNGPQHNGSPSQQDSIAYPSRCITESNSEHNRALVITEYLGENTKGLGNIPRKLNQKLPSAFHFGGYKSILHIGTWIIRASAITLNAIWVAYNLSLLSAYAILVSYLRACHVECGEDLYPTGSSYNTENEQGNTLGTMGGKSQLINCVPVEAVSMHDGFMESCHGAAKLVPSDVRDFVYEANSGMIALCPFKIAKYSKRYVEVPFRYRFIVRAHKRKKVGPYWPVIVPPSCGISSCNSGEPSPDSHKEVQSTDNHKTVPETVVESDSTVVESGDTSGRTAREPPSRESKPAAKSCRDKTNARGEDNMDIWLRMDYTNCTDKIADFWKSQKDNWGNFLSTQEQNKEGNINYRPGDVPSKDRSGYTMHQSVQEPQVAVNTLFRDTIANSNARGVSGNQRGDVALSKRPTVTSPDDNTDEVRPCVNTPVNNMGNISNMGGAPHRRKRNGDYVWEDVSSSVASTPSNVVTVNTPPSVVDPATSQVKNMLKNAAVYTDSDASDLLSPQGKRKTNASLAADLMNNSLSTQHSGDTQLSAPKLDVDDVICVPTFFSLPKVRPILSETVKLSGEMYQLCAINDLKGMPSAVISCVIPQEDGLTSVVWMKNINIGHVTHMHTFENLGVVLIVSQVGDASNTSTNKDNLPGLTAGTQPRKSPKNAFNDKSTAFVTVMEIKTGRSRVNEKPLPDLDLATVNYFVSGHYVYILFTGTPDIIALYSVGPTTRSNRWDMQEIFTVSANIFMFEPLTDIWQMQLLNVSHNASFCGAEDEGSTYLPGVFKKGSNDTDCPITNLGQCDGIIGDDNFIALLLYMQEPKVYVLTQQFEPHTIDVRNIPQTLTQDVSNRAITLQTMKNAYSDLLEPVRQRVMGNHGLYRHVTNRLVHLFHINSQDKSQVVVPSNMNVGFDFKTKEQLMASALILGSKNEYVLLFYEYITSLFSKLQASRICCVISIIYKSAVEWNIKGWGEDTTELSAFDARMLHNIGIDILAIIKGFLMPLMTSLFWLVEDECVSRNLGSTNGPPTKREPVPDSGCHQYCTAGAVPCPIERAKHRIKDASIVDNNELSRIRTLFVTLLRNVNVWERVLGNN